MKTPDNGFNENSAGEKTPDGFIDLSNPPALNLAQRSGTSHENAVRASCNSSGEVATGLLLLWHDHWDAAHEIAQSDEGEQDHDLLHAIVHRREGDFSNAAYWFRGAGAHPCFARIPGLLQPLAAQDPPLFRKLLPDGHWDPHAFLDAVRKGENPDLLRAVQAREFLTFLNWLTGSR